MLLRVSVTGVTMCWVRSRGEARVISARTHHACTEYRPIHMQNQLLTKSYVSRIHPFHQIHTYENDDSIVFVLSWIIRFIIYSMSCFRNSFIYYKWFERQEVEVGVIKPISIESDAHFLDLLSYSELFY